MKSCRGRLAASVSVANSPNGISPCFVLTCEQVDAKPARIRKVGEEEAWVLLEDLSTLASQAQSDTVRPIGRQDELMGMVARQAGGSSKHGGALFAHGVAGMFAFPLGEAERKGRVGAAALQVDPGMLEDCLEMVEGERRLTVEESERAAGFLQALVRQRPAFDGTDADVRVRPPPGAARRAAGRASRPRLDCRREVQRRWRLSRATSAPRRST
jgi:hypothetical protein